MLKKGNLWSILVLNLISNTTQDNHQSSSQSHQSPTYSNTTNTSRPAEQESAYSPIRYVYCRIIQINNVISRSGLAPSEKERQTQPAQKQPSQDKDKKDKKEKKERKDSYSPVPR